MNFQKLFGPLTKPREDRFFDDIIGHADIKRLFFLGLRSEEPTHLLLSAPPASAKTMFLLSLKKRLKDSYFIDGGNTTKAGIIDYLFKNRAPYIVVDEIDAESYAITKTIQDVIGILQTLQWGDSLVFMDLRTFPHADGLADCPVPGTSAGDNVVATPNNGLFDTMSFYQTNTLIGKVRFVIHSNANVVLSAISTTWSVIVFHK